MAELRRNQRGEIGRQHVKAHSCSHFSPCFDHTHHAHPDIDHDMTPTMTSEPTSPTLVEQCHGFFYVSFQLKYRDEGDKVTASELRKEFHS